MGCARFLRSGQDLHFRCDREASGPWLESLDIYAAAASLGPETALLLMHARGDEQVPFEISERLHEAAHEPKRLLSDARRPPPLDPARRGAAGGVRRFIRTAGS